MNLNLFMQHGIADIAKTAGRFYVKNEKGRAFMARMLPQILRSAKLRTRNENAGRHVPPFLIASIASQCNLRCAGCYARAGGDCSDIERPTDMTKDDWARVFAEAASLGTSFILLAGGEPLLRRDVIALAAQQPSVVFPIFTNGTLLDADYLSLFDESRNLIPVLSIEGDEQATDARRGMGVHAGISAAMERLCARGILFGASVTVTRQNLDAVLSPAFADNLRAQGCGALIYVEYVPAEKGTEHLALLPEELVRMTHATEALKTQVSDMVILSFPGDEEAMGGCLASGRGFFHISADGGAEPCPFSPYAALNLKTASIADILDSDYFTALRTLQVEAGPHSGGCLLFQREEAVKHLLASAQSAGA